MPREPTDDAGMEGFPGDGDEFQPADPTPPTPEPPAPPADPMADVRARMDRLERENENLRRLIPPATPRDPAPRPPAPPEDEFDSVDWDRELFANPKDAIRKAMNMASERTEKRLRAEYQRDRGTTQFWDRFYVLHPDLKDDHDLVEVTLNSNLASLANIPVDEAYGKLAELTRDRIVRYAGGAARSRPKARAEGGGAAPVSQPSAPKPSEEKVASISSYLRERRQKRRAGAV